MPRRNRIVATRVPATDNAKTLRPMLEACVDVAQLNVSPGRRTDSRIGRLCEAARFGLPLTPGRADEQPRRAARAIHLPVDSSTGNGPQRSRMARRRAHDV